ncbi:MAG: hypothetical protein LBM69_07190 [Lachnospiraceae bacterium]|jgi:hypothetical protein|nr:hypothetical protein [Lachnospiraceae bacterium]
MTTKEQERQEIEKIRKIVEGMGENSYLATAMEGVLEVAEENIEADAAFSLKGRAEVAEKEAAELKAENEELRKTLKDTLDEGRKTNERVKWLQTSLDDAYKKLEKYTIPVWIQTELKKMVETELAVSELKIRQAAEKMAQAIEEGEGASEQTADEVKRYREKRKEEGILIGIRNFLMRFKPEEQ